MRSDEAKELQVYFYYFLKGVKMSPLLLCLLVSQQRKSRNGEGYRKNGVTLLLPLLPLAARGETSFDILDILEPVGHQNLQQKENVMIMTISVMK